MKYLCGCLAFCARTSARAARARATGYYKGGGRGVCAVAKSEKKIRPSDYLPPSGLRLTGVGQNVREFEQIHEW